MPKKRVSHKNKKGQQSSAKDSPRNTKDENSKGPSTNPQGTPGDGEKAWPMKDGATGSVDSRTNSSLQRIEDARRTVESIQRGAPPCQASNSSTSRSSQGQPKFYDIYLKFSKDTVDVHRVKDIIRRNDWTMMTAADSRLGVPKMTSIEDALETCSHVVLIITKEDCEKDDTYWTMTMGMAFQSTVGRSLNGRVISIRCCEESLLPLSLQSLENACIDDRSLEDKLKRTIDVSIRKKKEGSSVAITPMRLDEEDVQRDRMASLPNSSRLVDQPSGDGEAQENWLENLPELTELILWKVSEVISPRRLMSLGLKLGLSQIKLKILLDERSTISQQEEITFKMLYQWYNDQVGDLSKFFFKVLTTDAGLKQEQVFNLFFEKQHTCTSSSGRSFQDFQLWEIAEELHVDKLIPLSLRLGMTYARICRIRKESNLHSVNVCYNVIMQWQKEQTSQTDQVETLARILDACHERRKAYKIRQNHLGVTNEGKTLLISEDQPMKGVTEVQLNVTHSNQLVREEAQGNLQALLDASSSEVSLVPSTGEAADFVERLKSIGRDGFYKLIGLTHDFINFRVKVNTIEGLRWLRSDVQSGRIRHQLGKVLVSEKNKQQVLEDIDLDVVLEGRGARDLLSHAVIDPIPPSTSLSTDFENREALKGDRTSSSDLMAQQGHPVVPEATVRKQVVNQEEGNSGLLACSSPLATPGAVASVAPHVSMRQEKCGPEDAVDEDSVTSTEKAYSALVWDRDAHHRISVCGGQESGATTGAKWSKRHRLRRPGPSGRHEL